MNNTLTPKKLVTLLMIALPALALTACSGSSGSAMNNVAAAPTPVMNGNDENFDEPGTNQPEVLLTPTSSATDRAAMVYTGKPPSSLSCKNSNNTCNTVSLDTSDEDPLQKVIAAFDQVQENTSGSRFSVNYFGVSGTFNSPSTDFELPQKQGVNIYLAGTINAKNVNINKTAKYTLAGTTIDAKVNVDKNSQLLGSAHIKGDVENQGLLSADFPYDSEAALTLKPPFRSTKLTTQDVGEDVKVAQVGIFIDGNYTQDGAGSLLRFLKRVPVYVHGKATFNGGLIYADTLSCTFRCKTIPSTNEAVLLSSSGIKGNVHAILGKQAPSPLGSAYKGLFIEPGDAVTFDYMGKKVAALVIPQNITDTSQFSIGAHFFKLNRFDPSCDSLNPDYACEEKEHKETDIAQVKESIDKLGANTSEDNQQPMQAIFTGSISGTEDITVTGEHPENEGTYPKTISFTGDISIPQHTLYVRQNTTVYAFNNHIKGNVTVAPDKGVKEVGTLIATNVTMENLTLEDGNVIVLGSYFNDGFSRNILHPESYASILYNYKKGVLSGGDGLGPVYAFGKGVQKTQHALSVISYPVSAIVKGDLSMGEKGNLAVNNGVLYVKGTATLGGTLYARYEEPSSGGFYAAVLFSDHEFKGKFTQIFYGDDYSNTYSSTPEQASVQVGDTTIHTLLILLGEAPEGDATATEATQARALRTQSVVAKHSASNRETLQSLNLGNRSVTGHTASGRAVTFNMPVRSALAELGTTLMETHSNAIEGLEYVNAQRVNTRTRLMLSNGNWFGLYQVGAKPAVRFDAGVILGSHQRLSHVEQLQVSARLGQTAVRGSLSYVGSRFNGAYKDKDSANAHKDRLSTSSAFGVDLGAAQVLPELQNVRVSAQASFYHFSNTLVRENVGSTDTHKVDSARNTLQLDLGVGKDFVLNAAQITPFVGYRFAMLNQGKVEEKLMDTTLTVDAQNHYHNSLLAGVNAQMASAFDLKGLGLNAGLALAYRFNDTAMDAKLSDASDSVALPFKDDVRFSAYAQFGVNYEVGPVRAGMSTQLLMNGSVDAAFKANVSYEF